MKLNANEVTLFLIGLAVMLLFARSFGELLKKFRQPIVIGEIIAGIILGPTIFGYLFPDIFHNLFVKSENIIVAHEGITTIAVVMLMLVSGLEIDLGTLLKQGKAAVTTSLMGVIFPFTIGFSIAYLFPHTLGINNEEMRLVFALFIGTALSITALPVVAKTLMDLNILKSEIGFLIIASAMMNDLIGWIIFSLILSNMSAGTDNLPFLQVVIITFSFIIFFLVFGRKLFDKAISIIHKNMTFPGGVLNFVLISGFLGAAFTEYIGIHAIFGAFIIGISIGDSAQLKENTKEIIHQFVTNIFAPIFFVSIGLRVNFIDNFDFMLVTIFIVLAFIGKVVGCGLGARWGGLSKVDSLAVGFGMNSRGAMEIVLGILALQFGLIQEKVFVALVIMALVTSISSAPFMNIFIRRSVKFVSLNTLINKKLVLFTSAKSKDILLSQMVEKISEFSLISKSDLLKSIIQREELFPTGIQNFLAIPHAKFQIKRPVIAIAINEFELDFGASDDIGSKIFLMIVTPQSEHELQLKLLAEVASKFRNKAEIEKLLIETDRDKLIERIQNLS